MKVWAVQDEKTGDVIGIYSTAQKAYGALIKFIEDEVEDAEDAKAAIEELRESFEAGSFLFYVAGICHAEAMRVE